MRGKAEIKMTVVVLCYECGRGLSCEVRDGIGSIPTEIKVEPCEHCQAEACERCEEVDE